MNKIYGTDGNVYETSISNGREYTSSKKEKEEFAVAELEKILSYTNNMAKNIIEQGPPDFNGFGNKDEALALYGFVCIKITVENKISELKGEKE